MANWCNTRFIFYSENTEQLTDFYNKLKEYTSENFNTKNSWGNDWLGNIVMGFGFDPDKDNIRCRGCITFIDDELIGDSFALDTETAWVPMTGMWNSILSKYYPDIEYVFQAEEQGCEIYLTSDIDRNFFGDRYYIDTCVNGIYYSEYSSSEKGVISLINDIFGLKGDNRLSTLLEAMAYVEKFNNASDDDDFAYIHEFETVSNYDWS